MQQFEHELHRDYEDYSVLDIRLTGTQKRARHSSTSVWCMSYAVDDGPAKLWTPGAPCPPEFIECARNPKWQAVAHNATHEIGIEREIMTPRFGWPEIPLERQRCTMVEALAMSLPASLEALAKVLMLPEKKDSQGSLLMKKMARPRGIFPYGSLDKKRAEQIALWEKDDCSPFLGGFLSDGSFVTWYGSEENRKRLGEYCLQDTVTEQAVSKRLVPLDPRERDFWMVDHRINERGVLIHVRAVENAVKVLEFEAAQLARELTELTNGEVRSVNQVAQMLRWIKETEGLDLADLTKATVAGFLGREDISSGLRRVLEIRRDGAKASTAKFKRMLSCVCDDGRVRGIMQFHGATTGRFAGRLIQVQNFPRPETGWKPGDTKTVLAILGNENCTPEELSLGLSLFGPPLKVLSNCLRAFLSAPESKIFRIADYPNVEGRGLSLLAGQEDKLDAFRAADAHQGPDLYLVNAASIFGVPIETLNKHSPERQAGKTCELAFGYQGGVGAYRAMETTTRNSRAFTDKEVLAICQAWRKRWSKIPGFWKAMEYAAVSAVSTPGKVTVAGAENFEIRFKAVGAPMNTPLGQAAATYLIMRLPSGRKLFYPFPRLQQIYFAKAPEPENPETDSPSEIRRITKNEVAIYESSGWDTWDKLGLSFQGFDTGRKWTWLSTYGGSLVENVTQAFCRDILREGIMSCEEHGFKVVFHVHDEVVAEDTTGADRMAEFNECLTPKASWCAGLPLPVESEESQFYKK